MDHDDFEGMIAMLEHCGLSKTTIARETGVSYSTVWRMANGTCNDTLARHGRSDRGIAAAVTARSGKKVTPG